MKRTVPGLAALTALVAALLAAAIYGGFASDLRAARTRIDSGASIARTACGEIEYSDHGRGPAVLVVHGAGGGHDQGSAFGRALVARGFRVVAMSRFGYLRTPLPADASPEAQADAHACLLDALSIERAAVVGVSAGGPSSLQMALRHPARTSALVLLVPLAYRPGPAPPPPSRAALWIYERVLRSDFLYWLALHAAPDVLVENILATPPKVLHESSPEEQRRAEDMLEEILPLSRRQQGLLNDSAVAQSLQPSTLERVGVPTLVVSLPDDLFGTYEGAMYTARRIPDAVFIDYPSGGHVWLGHHEELVGTLAAFLAAG